MITSCPACNSRDVYEVEKEGRCECGNCGEVISQCILAHSLQYEEDSTVVIGHRVSKHANQPYLPNQRTGSRSFGALNDTKDLTLVSARSTIKEVSTLPHSSSSSLSTLHIRVLTSSSFYHPRSNSR